VKDAAMSAGFAGDGMHSPKLSARRGDFIVIKRLNDLSNGNSIHVFFEYTADYLCVIWVDFPKSIHILALRIKLSSHHPIPIGDAGRCPA
jgi:hypothetical protein